MDNPNATAPKRYKGEGKVAFLANLSSIRTLIEEGWPIQAVYDKHRDKVNIKYMQFHRYVSKYIKDAPAGNGPKEAAPVIGMPPVPTPVGSTKDTTATQEKPLAPTTSVPMTFFKPNAIPDKSKLI